MLSDIIIIIPTHKRQHYLNRVAWYYSHFNMQVYICDSTPETAFEIDKYDNINYLWCPDKTFYTKILYVLESTDAAYCATSPDDDFLKYETLMECYEAMKADSSYSLAVGRQVFFKEHLNESNFWTSIPYNRLQGIKLYGSKILNSLKFWRNYQNVLWSVFRKEILLISYHKLVKLQYDSQNFIEITLGMSSLIHGNIYVSNNALNFRELIKGEHWGSDETVISIANYFKNPSMKSDIQKFWFQEDKLLCKIGFLSYLTTTIKYFDIARYIWEAKVCRRNLHMTKYYDIEMNKLIKKALTHVKF